MSEKKPVFGTADGRKRLEEELQFRRGEKQQLIAEEMGKAIEQGDLRENAAYDEARRAMWDNNSRISELDDILNRFQIVDGGAGDNTKINIGATVELHREGKPALIYTIVGSQESDVFNGKISNESPLGTLLMGKRQGDKVEVKNAKARTVYTIANLHYE